MKKGRDGFQWGEIEKSKMLKMAEDKFTLSEISQALNRSERTTYQKLKSNGLYKQQDGTLGTIKYATKSKSFGKPQDAVKKIEVHDYVNHNGEPEFGKVHPMMLAKNTLGNRLDITTTRTGDKIVRLDGKMMSGGYMLITIMKEVNKVRLSHGKEQVLSSPDWRV